MTLALPKAPLTARPPRPRRPDAFGMDTLPLPAADCVGQSDPVDLDREPFGPSMPHPLEPSLGLAGTEVLLVEDDLLVASAMRQLLQSWGQTVLHVETAAEALQHADFGQLAICDVRLPDGESGIDVALHLRSLGKKVLLISGETDTAVRQRAQNNRLLLLIKPVSSAMLMKTLRDL